MRQGPLAGRYTAVAAMVVSALVPYLALSGAFAPLTPFLGRQLHMSTQSLGLTTGMANAAYAIGTVLAVQFALLLPQRRMLLVYAVLLLTGSVLAAAATSPPVFIVGHVIQGLCTSLLLIAAVPPLIIGYPPKNARYTSVILNLCIFGAVALGPVIGGIQANAHAWRPLFWIVAGVALAALLLATLTFQDAPPADPGGPRDPLAVSLAAGGCAAAFFGASELLTHRFVGPLTLAPLVVGLGLILALLVLEYRGTCRLLNVRALVSTMPTTGIIVAICAAAASISAIVLSGAVLGPRHSPLHLGLLYLPEFGGAVISAVVFGIVFRTRALHYFVLTGMILLSAGIIVIGRIIPPSDALTLAGSGLIGVGVGSAVAPALYIVGFSLQSANLQRVFAIVELLRGVAAFMIAPIMLHFALTVGHSASAGTTTALWICFGISAGGAVIGIAFFALGGVRRPPSPAFESWLAGEGPAWNSPPLLAAVRKEPGLPVVTLPAAGSADARPYSQTSPSHGGAGMKLESDEAASRDGRESTLTPRSGDD
jgi:MFS family permease